MDKMIYTVMWGEDQDATRDVSPVFSTKLQAFEFAIELADKGKKGIAIDEFNNNDISRNLINSYYLRKN